MVEKKMKKTMEDLQEGMKKTVRTIRDLQGERRGTIKESMDDLCEALENEIISGNADEETKKELLKKFRKFCSTETNIMLVGATGSGKSSTINALFGCGETEGVNETDSGENGSKYIEVAKVGSKADPKTRDIEKYTIGKLILWDTPGLGDGTEIDVHHRDVIRELLREEDEDGNALIDLVLVILDGSTKDLGTSYKLINEILIPELGDETNRILVALNQADIAMKIGRHWDYEKNQPDEVLVEYLEQKAVSIRERIKEDSGIDIDPIYYCAGYKEESGEVLRPYNLSKLLYYILSALPTQKRIAIMEGINTDADNYESNDDDMDYNQAVTDSFLDGYDIYVSEGVDKGAEIGHTILGIPGLVVGAVIGGAIGSIKSILSDIF